jgi:hypothetical protein
MFGILRKAATCTEPLIAAASRAPKFDAWAIQTRGLMAPAAIILGAATMAPLVMGAIAVSTIGLLPSPDLFDKINKHERLGTQSNVLGFPAEAVIDWKEFKQFCNSKELFAMLDHDDSGLIDYHEFQLATLMLSGRRPGELFEWLFTHFDTTGDEKLTKKEFRRGITHLYALVDLFSEGQLELEGKCYELLTISVLSLLRPLIVLLLFSLYGLPRGKAV